MMVIFQGEIISSIKKKGKGDGLFLLMQHLV